MPIYEYECAHCGHSLETIQKISDPPIVQCPACKQDSLKKLVSAPSFRLKGQGWYETDFKQDKRRNLVESGSADKANNDTAPESGKTDKSNDTSASASTSTAPKESSSSTSSSSGSSGDTSTAK